MRKLSEIMIELVSEILAQPMSMTSTEGLHSALMLANVAWNRSIDRAEADTHGHYLDALAQFERDNPRARADLISYDCEDMIMQLQRSKAARYASDNRFIVVCGTTPAGNVHVEWTPREITAGSRTRKPSRRRDRRR